jgi:DNA-binding NarL/FixJ family response regulator
VKLANDAVSAGDLSRRDLQLLRYLADGKSGSEIAHELGIVTKTVDNLKVLLYRKLGVKRATAAVAEAQRRKIL